MKLTKETILKVVTYLVIIVFMFLYVNQGNYEFMWYNVAALLFFWLVMYLYKQYDIPFIVVVGFSIWLFLHMFGGLDLPNRVYGIMLINIIGDPFYILRYDQFVHFYCYAVVGAIFYSIVKKSSKKVTWMVLATAVLAAVGVGSLNEIFEFSMVLFLENTGVGDMYNTGLDLVFNLIGALFGVLLSHKLQK